MYPLQKVIKEQQIKSRECREREVINVRKERTLGIKQGRGSTEEYRKMKGWLFVYYPL